jgi:hypothetical protein
MTLAEAMESRAYGTSARTHFSIQRWAPYDTLVSVTALLGVAGFLALVATGGAPGWFPFPALSAPAISVPALLCCALLVVPSLRVWH